jgi:hypothetical protein
LTDLPLASVVRRYATEGPAVPTIHLGAAGGEPPRMITWARASSDAGD